MAMWTSFWWSAPRPGLSAACSSRRLQEERFCHSFDAPISGLGASRMRWYRVESVTDPVATPRRSQAISKSCLSVSFQKLSSP